MPFGLLHSKLGNITKGTATGIPPLPLAFISKLLPPPLPKHPKYPMPSAGLQVHGTYLMQAPRKWGNLDEERRLGHNPWSCEPRPMMLADPALACQQDLRLSAEENEVRITHGSRGVFGRNPFAKGPRGLDLGPRRK